MVLQSQAQAERDAGKYKGLQAIEALASIDLMLPERAAALRPHLEAEVARWTASQAKKKLQKKARQRPESNQLELFGGMDVLPRRPFACNDFTENRRRSRADALGCKYIQVNQPVIDNFIVIDCDHADPYWQSSDLPAPCWVAATKRSGRHHVTYRLKTGVVTGEQGRKAPQGLLRAVRLALVSRLAGDPGYVGLLTKNPLHSSWDVLLPGGQVGLYELADALQPELEELKQRRGNKDAPRPRWSQSAAEAALTAAGEGMRNKTLFAALRQWAYRNIGADLYRQAALFNSLLPAPLPESEVRAIAASVARFLARHRFIQCGHSAELSEAQRARGRQSGVARLAASEDKRASARLMKAQGQSVRAIAAELGVGKSTVSDWCRSVSR
jgi:hypothetical protein